MSIEMLKNTKLNLTEIKNLSSHTEKTDYFPIEGYRGLIIQITKSGSKAFVIRYRVNGFQRILTLGGFPEMTPDMARKAWHSAWAIINSGQDPLQLKAKARKVKEEKKVSETTVSQLADRWLGDHVKPNRSENTIRMYEWITRQYIKPKLGEVAVKDLTKGMLDPFLKDIRKHAPHTSNRVRSVLSAMFTKAELWDLRLPGTNPAKGQEKAPESKRERRLSEPELIWLESVLRHLEGEESPNILLAIQLLLLTGMRKEECLSLKWCDININDGYLRIEHHKTMRIIGARTVYLCSAALQLLSQQPRLKGNPYLLPGAKAGSRMINLKKPWKRILETSDALQEEQGVPLEKRLDLHDVTLHDLRRTFASVATDLGYPELVTGALLGHAAGTVTAGYARAGGNRLIEVVEDIGGRVADLLAGKIDLEKEAQERRLARVRSHAG